MLRYVAIVRGAADPRWRDRMLAALHARGAARCFDASGDLRDVGAHDGRWEWIDVEELPVVAPTACPYVGDAVGGLAWEWWPGHVSLDNREWLAESILAAGRGTLVRTTDERRFEPIVRVAFPLIEASRRHGFADGSFFLDNDARYVADVRAAILAGLRAAGLDAELINYGTGHNPHRFDQQRAHDVAHAQHILETTTETLPLWGWAFALADERAALRALLDPAIE
jgi:hypothetical protein